VIKLHVKGVRNGLTDAVGAVAVVIWPFSDRTHEGKWNTALAFLVASGGMALSTYFPDPMHKMTVLYISAIGMFAIAPLFWTLPTAFLSGTAAAGGIALIKSIGNLAGFATPYAMGYLKDRPAGLPPGCWSSRSFPFLSAVLVLIIGHNPALERSVAAAE
jgi:MFS transporter, ACS family, tartrate transporter